MCRIERKERTLRVIATIFLIIGLLGCPMALFGGATSALIMCKSVEMLCSNYKSFELTAPLLGLGLMMPIAAGLVLLVQYGLYLRGRKLMRSASTMWRLTSAYNGLLSLFSIIVAFGDKSPGLLLGSAWFLALAILASYAHIKQQDLDLMRQGDRS